jgi:hypothetical protein
LTPLVESSRWLWEVEVPELVGSTTMSAGAVPAQAAKAPLRVQLKIIESIRNRGGFAWPREVRTDLFSSIPGLTDAELSSALSLMIKDHTLAKNEAGQLKMSTTADPDPPKPKPEAKLPKLHSIGEWGTGEGRGLRIRRARTALSFSQQQLGLLAFPEVTRGNAQNIMSRVESGRGTAEEVVHKVIHALEKVLVDRGFQKPEPGQPWPQTNGSWPTGVASTPTPEQAAAYRKAKSDKIDKPTGKASKKIKSMARTAGTDTEAQPEKKLLPPTEPKTVSNEPVPAPPEPQQVEPRATPAVQEPSETEAQQSVETSEAEPVETSEVKQLREQLSVKTEELACKSQELSRSEAWTEKLKVQLKSLDETVSRLEGKIADQHEKIADLGQKIAERDQKVAELKATIDVENQRHQEEVRSLKDRLVMSGAQRGGDLAKLEEELSRTLDAFGVEANDDLRVRLGFLRGYVAGKGGLK